MRNQICSQHTALNRTGFCGFSPFFPAYQCRAYGWDAGKPNITLGPDLGFVPLDPAQGMRELNASNGLVSQPCVCILGGVSVSLAALLY